MRCDGCGHERQDGSPVCDVESCPCRCHLPNLRRARIRMAAANWPHLLARVLYVPGMCAAIAARADRHRRMRFALMVEVEAERMYNIGGDMSCDDVAYQLRQVADNIRRCDP